MSASSAIAAILPGRVFAEPFDRRVLRYALGSTIAMAVAMGFAWDDLGASTTSGAARVVSAQIVESVLEGVRR